jgi:osmotically-inducible protein OsmY
MISYSHLSTLTCAVILSGVLPGCATTNPKCGADGCQGDAQITADVQALFDTYPALEPPNILTVQTADRIVFLNGLVATDLERDIAETVALRASGVAMVVNGIAVTEK